MNVVRSFFISAYVGFVWALLAYALLQVFRGHDPLLSWVGLALAAGTPAAFFGWLYIARTPRTNRHPLAISTLSGLGLAITMAMNWRFPTTTAIIHVWAGLSLLGWFLYLRWYSVFRQRHNKALEPGSRLPEFTVETLDGEPLSSASFRGKAFVLVFYRGNWCPLCSAQVHELARAYREIEDMGAGVALISSQPPGNSRQLAARFDAPMQFFHDPGNRAARELGIENPWGTPMGMQALGYGNHNAMPTVIIIDPDGCILYADQTDNYRVRPEPKVFIEILRSHR